MNTNSKYRSRQKKINKFYEMMYPGLNQHGINSPLPGNTFDEVTMQEFYTDLLPKDLRFRRKSGR